MLYYILGVYFAFNLYTMLLVFYGIKEDNEKISDYSWIMLPIVLLIGLPFALCTMIYDLIKK